MHWLKFVVCKTKYLKTEGFHCAALAIMTELQFVSLIKAAASSRDFICLEPPLSGDRGKIIIIIIIIAQLLLLSYFAITGICTVDAIRLSTSTFTGEVDLSSFVLK